MRRKIVFIFRKPKDGAFSIEMLFSSVIDEMRKDSSLEIVQYILHDRKNIFSDARELRALNADVYHVTGDVHYVIPLLIGKRVILTVHDVNHLQYNLSGIKKRIYKLLWFTIPLHCATRLTAISETTRSQVLEILKARRKQIAVIPNCLPPEFRPEPYPEIGENPRLLVIGTARNKNLARIMEATVDLKCELNIVGPLNHEVRAMLKKYGTNFKNYVNLTQVEMLQHYYKAHVVLFPSLYEGFGMPIIEAQACGRPVLTSNREPMKSVAGTGACLVDPLSVNEIKKSLSKMLSDTQYRNQLIDIGFKNIEKYQVARIARMYREQYFQYGDDKFKRNDSGMKKAIGKGSNESQSVTVNNHSDD